MIVKSGIGLSIIVLVSAFYLLTIRKGETWSDDYAMYIHEAKNLSEGIPLDETGYIYNPQRPWVGPRVYPTVFPAILIPGYLLGHTDNFTPMKVEIVIFFIGLLLVLWKGLGSELSPSHQAMFLAIIGLNPFLWQCKDSIVSDIPFTFLLYLVFSLASRLVGSDEADRRFWWASALGAVTYLCYGTRIIGIVLVPALLVLSVLRWRHGGRIIAWATVFASALCLIQQRLLGSETSYKDMLKISMHKFIGNVNIYAWSLSTYWGTPHHKLLRDIVFVFATVLALLGYFVRVRSSIRIYEIFIPLYLGAVLLYPDPAGGRYLIPIFPLYVFYSLDGIGILNKNVKRDWAQAVRVSVFALIFLSYGTQFAELDFGPIKEGVRKSESRELFSFIRNNTRAADVIIFRRPRALALFTQRNASIYPATTNPAEFCRYFRRIHATYLIEAPALDDPNFDHFLNSGSLQGQLAFRNSDFSVLRIQPDDIDRCVLNANR